MAEHERACAGGYNSVEEELEGELATGAPREEPPAMPWQRHDEPALVPLEPALPLLRAAA